MLSLSQKRDLAYLLKPFSLRLKQIHFTLYLVTMHFPVWDPNLWQFVLLDSQIPGSSLGMTSLKVMISPTPVICTELIVSPQHVFLYWGYHCGIWSVLSTTSHQVTLKHQHPGHQLCSLWAMRQINIWFRIDEPAAGWRIKWASFKVATYVFSLQLGSSSSVH